MKKTYNPDQFIIAIDRECESGGQQICDILSKRLNIPLYDHNIIDELKKSGALQGHHYHEIDENPRSFFFSRTVRGLTNSNEEGLAMLEFDFLRDKAREGDSFIVLGHCANEILKDYPGLIPIFISADEEFKIERAVQRDGFSREDAKLFIVRKSKERKNYHNSYCSHKWGDSRHYELCLKTNPIGIEKTVDFIEDYLRLRMKKEKHD